MDKEVKQVKVGQAGQAGQAGEQKEERKEKVSFLTALSKKAKSLSSLLRRKKEENNVKKGTEEEKDGRKRLFLGFGIALVVLAVLGIFSGKLFLDKRTEETKTGKQMERQVNGSTSTHSYERKREKERRREKERKKKTKLKRQVKERVQAVVKEPENPASDSNLKRTKTTVETAKRTAKKESNDIGRVNLKAFQRFYLSLLNEQIREKKEELKKLEEEIKKLQEERIKLTSPMIIKVPPKPKKEKKPKKEVVLFPIKVRAILCSDNDCRAITNFGVLTVGEKVGSETVKEITSDCVITDKRKLCVGQ